jgi:hypothetical protein
MGFVIEFTDAALLELSEAFVDGRVEAFLGFGSSRGDWE